MYAIIRTGGKQYRVKAGDVLRVEKLDQELGAEFDVTDILVVGGDKTFVGTPTISDAKVTAVVTRQAKAPKVIVFKKKRRQGYRKMQGHRQWFTELFIKSITTPEGDTAKADSEAQVYDPLKKQEIVKRRAEEKKEAKKPGGKAEAPVAKKATKKAAGKKKATKKKTTAKKKTAKKKTAKKKTAKKATKKKS